MARKWVQSAIKPSNSGVFKKKAEAAGKTTREFAEEHAHSPGKLGKQARLAETLMSMHHGKSRRSKLYDGK
jgi:hypothetical protein